MAADVLFLEYPKCSTCQKAKKWLDAHGVTYADRHIVELILRQFICFL